MIFWMGVLAGGLFVWLALRMGFFETWALLFNIVISIYLSIFLGPAILDLVPDAANTSYCNALILAVTGVGAFLVLHGLTYVFYTSQFKVTFPRVFDVIFAGTLGFLTGFLVLSFAALVITATPVSNNQFLSNVGFNRDSQRANISYVCWWCDMVNSIVSLPDSEVTTNEIVSQLLSSQSPNTSPTLDKQTEQDNPGQPQPVRP